MPIGRSPDWSAPDGVAALMTGRAGGASVAPWKSLNLGIAVGDATEAVAENRQRVAAAAGAAPVWLRQVHGARVVRVGADQVGHPPLEADACWTDEPGIACAVQVADCLPVLFAARNGRAVAAAHAGWRGLAAGVLEAALDAVARAAGVAPGEVAVWLGPCIGPRQFEVGEEVVHAFGADPAPVEVDPHSQRFLPRLRADGSAGWLVDLQGLARDRLHAAGVVAGHIGADRRCTVESASELFSFRRDGVTGRMAALVWLRG